MRSTRSRAGRPAPKPFTLLVRPSAVRPLQAERAAWVRAAASCRELARRASAACREDPSAFGPATEALFDLVGRSDFLPAVAPSGRIPRDFAGRCLRVAERRTRVLAIEREALRVARKGSRESGTGLTTSDVRRLARLAASYPGEPEEGLRRGVLALPGTPHAIDRRGRILRRETIPGSEIDLGPPVAGKAASSAARRLGRALALVDAAWPEAGREIRARTRLVLTPEEQGLVSYSHLHRPGVSYIRLRGKSILDLADDLLHETAHHRLHDLEERTPLFASVPSGGEEVRYYSPWRRALRPVRGIYHAAYTFSFRAELFRRILSRARDAEGRVGPLRLRPEKLRWIEQEARNERRQVLRALDHLGDAARRGFLSARGRRMLATIREAASARAAA